MDVDRERAGAASLLLSPDTIQELYDAGLINSQAQRALWRYLRPAALWWRWGGRLMLLAGTLLMIAGAFFFFASNYNRMGSFLKLGIIEVVLLLVVVALWFTGLDSLPGRALLLAGFGLPGLFLAVYGQVYQTGADDWRLYVLWALLVLGWVVVARFNLLWVTWLALVDVAIVLYWTQEAGEDWYARTAGLFLVLAALNGAMLAGREYGRRQSIGWLEPRWPEWVIWVSVLGFLLAPTLEAILDERGRYDLAWVAIAANALALAGGYLYFRWSTFDLPALALGVMSVCLIIITAAAKLLYDNIQDAGVNAIFGIVLLAVFAAAAFWLRREHRAMGEAGHA